MNKTWKKQMSLAEAARQTGIPYHVAYYYMNTGRINPPDDGKGYSSKEFSKVVKYIKENLKGGK